jgi:hypothetical protein
MCDMIRLAECNEDSPKTSSRNSYLPETAWKIKQSDVVPHSHWLGGSGSASGQIHAALLCRSLCKSPSIEKPAHTP